MDYFELHSRAKSYLHNGWFDINAPIDPVTEQGLLHYGAKWDDIFLLDWLLSNGADPNVTNKKGKKPIDFCTKKDSQTKDRLRSAISQTAFLSSNFVSPKVTENGNIPKYQGILLKWANYAVGYRSRYFVLENGVLSYYKSANEYPTSCKGSISLKVAKVVLPDADDKSRFDIVGEAGLKFSLKARTPTDAKKWIWVLMESKKWIEEKSKSDILTSPVDSPHPQDTDHFGDDHRRLDSSTTDLSKSDLRKSKEVDISSLMTSLQVQLEVQEKAIATIVEAVQELVPNHSFLKEAPETIKISSEQIIALVQSIADLATQKETLWTRRYKKQLAHSKRWEEILTKVLSATNIAQDEQGDGVPTSAKANGVSDKPSHEEIERPVSGDSEGVTVTLHQEDYSNESSSDDGQDEDIFFDAESDAPPMSLERMFGFGALEEEEMVVERPRGSDAARRLPAAISNASLSEQDAAGQAIISHKELNLAATGHLTISTARDRLPMDPKQPRPSLNVWSFLKSAIGKDLSKVTLPVFFNEPLSMLQRMCEDIEYIELLSLASVFGQKKPSLSPITQRQLQLRGIAEADIVSMNDKDAAMLRLLFVAGYAMSNYSSTVGRTNKPFNPMLVRIICFYLIVY